MKIKAQIERTVSDDSKIKAYASVSLDDEFVVRNIAVINGKNGLFAKMPSRVYRDRQGNTQYSDIVFGLTEEARSALSHAVLTAYEQKMQMQEEDTPAFEQGMQLS